MSGKFTEGTSFISGLGAVEKSDTIYRQQVANVRSGVHYRAWCRLREPFTVPDNVTNHSCEGHWEKFDVDKAACLTCSNIHVCHSLYCDTTCENDGIVCRITGLFLGQRLLSQYETPSDPVYEQESLQRNGNSYQKHKRLSDSSKRDTHSANNHTKNHTKNRCNVVEHLNIQDTDSIMRMVSNILLSTKTQQSIDTENAKMDSKFRAICMRRMRQYHLRRETPNLCDIEAHLHFKINGHRTPPPSVEESRSLRLECARRATVAIAQLLQFMRTYCGNVPTSVKHGGIVTGMLYIMRTGVTVDDITVLPRITELKRLLPAEQHLISYFNIRPKIVTEAENVIKYHMRNISPQSLSLLAQTQCIVRTT